MKTMQWILALGLTVCTGAFAQAPVDTNQAKAIRDLMEAMNFKQTMVQMTSAMSQQMPQMLDRMLDTQTKSSALSPEQHAEAKRIAREVVGDSQTEILQIFEDPVVLQGIEEVMARMYAKHFTTEEIQATAAFYSSPVGKKTLSTMPKVMQETMPEMMALMTPRMNAAMESAQKKLLAKLEAKKFVKQPSK